jgi:hypothetical protein
MVGFAQSPDPNRKQAISVPGNNAANIAATIQGRETAFNASRMSISPLIARGNAMKKPNNRLGTVHYPLLWSAIAVERILPLTPQLADSV